MKHLLPSIVVPAFLLVGAQAFSDNMHGDQMSVHHQMMQDCMTRMKAKNDGSTHHQMRTACTAEIKSHPPTNDGMSDHAMKPSDKTPEGTKPSDETPAK